MEKYRASGLVIFPDLDGEPDRLSLSQETFLDDFDYVDVICLPPYYLIQGSPKSYLPDNTVHVQGLVHCSKCRNICGDATHSSNWAPPTNYLCGFERRFCLYCWLVGDPHPESADHWVVTDTSNCEAEGRISLLRMYQDVLQLGYHLAVLPVARLQVPWEPIAYPGMTTFFPPGTVDLAELSPIANQDNSASLAERCNYASRVSISTFEQHPIVVFPCWFDWKMFGKSSHQSQLELIRSLSAIVDSNCFDLIRFRQCDIEPIHALPGRAGQTNDNPMMSGALIYNDSMRSAKIVGGDVFTHMITRGLGLPLESIQMELFPKMGEVGQYVRHALSLYTTMLETNGISAKFVQMTNLLEFLASLGSSDFRPFKDTKKNLVRYVTNDKVEYKRLMDRLFEMFGKRDETGKSVGYRTRIVHLGERLEDIVPRLKDRVALFEELQVIVSEVLKHMIAHSELTWSDYEQLRDSLGPYPI